MDEDDEFGDLYTDVLRPFSAVSAAPEQPLFTSSASAANPPPNLSVHRDDDDISYGVPDSNFPLSSHNSHQTLVSAPGKTEKEVIPGGTSGTGRNWNEGDGGVEKEVEEQEVSRVLEKVDETRVLRSGNEELPAEVSRVSETLGTSEKSGIGEIKDVDGDKNGVSMEKDDILSGEVMEEKLDIDVGVADLNSEPIIPGLSGGPCIPGVFDIVENEGDVKSPRREDSSGGGGDDWESDSEDDLQIVLNDKSGPLGMDRNEGVGSDDEDEDGEDLVIVADGDQHHPAIEEQDWGDDSVPVADRERKEVGEAVKANGGMVNAGGTRIGYSNHGYHPHHSQFKYVRPGAAVTPGGAIVGPGGAPGQVRPLVNVVPVAGRGRGDWRPIGVQTGPAMQKNFHSGFGLPVWANNSSGRGFGSGLEFTLPSHKTVFDIDIDIFEEKPWRLPGVDTSDFFNFGLDEEQWKAYCKQLEQHRLEATMQSKIRVYESGRSEQDYDPDLPPELAAAAGIHDASVENNAHLVKNDGGHGDVTGQGSGAARIRPPIPTGRAIQVEGGYGERLPSIDTKPPRLRDSDAIIEIVLQDSVDDDPITANDTLVQPETDLEGEDLKGGCDEEAIRQTNTECFDRFPQTYNGRKREVVGKIEPFVGSVHDKIHEGNGILPFPPEAPLQYHPGSKGRTIVYPGGSLDTPMDGRWPQGTTRDRYHHLTAEHGNDMSPSQSTRVNRLHDIQREKSGESIDGKQTPEPPSPVTADVASEAEVEHKVDVHDEIALADSSVAVEGEEIAMDMIIPSDTLGDGSLLNSVKKQNLSSQVEHLAVQDIGSGDDLRATRSSDNSKARSGSSRDYQKRRDGGEEEVVQDGRSRHMGDIDRRCNEGGSSFQRKDDYGRDGRQEMDRDRIVVRGREDSHQSYPHRDWDSNSTHPLRIKTGDIERPRERDTSVGSRQRRDGDLHGRRVKDEDTRKRVYVEEMGSKPRSRIRESERIENDEHLHSKKRLDNGDLRGRHDKDVGPRQRERDDYLMSRHENFDDAHAKRRKDEERQREKPDKEFLHGYRAREDTSRNKRERDDGLDQRRREDQPKVRDKSDDHHSVRYRDESWRHRERDDRKRLKQPHEDTLSNREREGRVLERSGRGTEEKPWVGNARAKDASKGLASEKDYQFKDNKRHNEQPKRSDRVDDDTLSQHRGRVDAYAREHQFNNEDRNPRHERSNTHDDRPVNASDSHRTHKEKHKENMSKEPEGGHQHSLGSSKRKQDDHGAHRSKKVSMKAASEQERGNVLKSAPTNSGDPGHSKSSSSVALSKKSHHEHEAPQQRHSSRKRREDAPSDDEQHNSRKGRSKLERWTSHKDRDENIITQTSLKVKEVGRDNNDLPLSSELPDEPVMTLESVSVGDQHPSSEDKTVGELEIKVAGKEPASLSRHVESDKVGDDRHLDTVAKLKKRSERFKVPMPSEKDAVANKVESEALVSALSETTADADIKPERPARKRRWISG